MNSLYGNYTRTRSFSEIFPDSNELANFYINTSMHKLYEELTFEQLEIVWEVLISNYANSHIISSDEDRFKFQLCSLIFRFAPTWFKKLDLQHKIRTLSEEDVVTGSKNISNHAFNPSSAPSVGAMEELDYINEQNVNGFKKAKIDAYNLQYAALEDDVTAFFVAVFKKLFRIIVEPEEPRWYVTEEEDD